MTMTTSLLLVAALAAQAPGSADPSASSMPAAEVETPAFEAPAAPPPAPEAPAPVEVPETLEFADHLFLDGDWYRSITEYRRFLFEVKGRHPAAPRAALAIGEALMRGQQWDAAGRQLDGVAQRTREGDLRNAALFAAGRAYLLDGRPELAKPRLRLIAQDDAAAEELRYESLWLLAWGHFDAGELELAYQYFNELAGKDGRRQKDAAGVADALLEEENLPRKDPLLAGALSLIPGAGHFYLGRWGVGLTSMVWNGIFLFAATHAWISGDIGVALVLTFFELGWYAGGVFGAMAGAHRYNRDAVRNWRDQIVADFGNSRDLPQMFELRDRENAPPGTLVRFGGAF
jgi:hypothetical protein